MNGTETIRICFLPLILFSIVYVAHWQILETVLLFQVFTEFGDVFYVPVKLKC